MSDYNNIPLCRSCMSDFVQAFTVKEKIGCVRCMTPTEYRTSVSALSTAIKYLLLHYTDSIIREAINEMDVDICFSFKAALAVYGKDNG